MTLRPAQLESPSEELEAAVCAVYSRIADEPGAEHPFAVGRPLAEDLAYPATWLDRLPSSVVASFAGVASVAVNAPIEPGTTVLDLGCGAGLDTLIAAWRTGPTGRVVAVDFSASMIERVSTAARTLGLGNVEVRQVEACHLPLADASVDLAMVNGIFNLNPNREAIFRELARVVRPEGSVHAAEIILREPLEVAATRDAKSWFS